MYVSDDDIVNDLDNAYLPKESGGFIPDTTTSTYDDGLLTAPRQPPIFTASSPESSAQGFAETIHTQPKGQVNI
ncbi:BgTH12-01917 [Blumeria graminis f. sp. triticale]|uniref:BgtAc-30277 n=3 Tax=Blumeria graminis TaxID=34373 RepID=A0A9X9MGF0_BLUGR|nr:hypothetical protein BGT96224_Ac30277 [Blumeria graminis f. sp. tritici 96224]CAD6501667.1 BgTH12-01917 [Blumeria graminis f. sp. triticale]VDB84281.1 BgtAc-30277 [Blumeria graminis f. sp. tritici]